MNSLKSLTLLQRGVLQRLREQGLPEVADRAAYAWPRGEQVVVVNLAKADQLLRQDFVKAQEHAVMP